MPRRLFVVAAALCAVACAPFDIEAVRMFAPTGAPDRIVLTWSQDPATTQSVTWRTSPEAGPPVGEIAVATDGPEFSREAVRSEGATEILDADLGLAQYHTVTFTGLQPDTKYAYRVGDGDVWSEWSHFTTPKAEPAPFSLIYFGDAQNNLKSHWSRVVREAFKDAPRAAFLLHAGDLVNRANSDAEWGEWFYSAGWILRTMPSIATPGNHEYRKGNLSQHWRPTFEFPRNGPEGFEETVYWLDVQGVRIVSLDTNRELEPQATWLAGVLQDNPHPWTIVTMHHPVYSTARRRDNPKLRRVLQPVFDRYGVDLVLQGHDHTYGRTKLMREGHEHGPRREANVPTGAQVQAGPGGTVYVVSVSGPKMYRLDQKPFMRSAVANKQLYQVLTVDGNQLTYKAYSATGDLFDAFELRKGPTGANDLIEY